MLIADSSNLTGQAGANVSFPQYFRPTVTVRTIQNNSGFPDVYSIAYSNIGNNGNNGFASKNGFRLEYLGQSTEFLNFNSSASDIRNALLALPNIYNRQLNIGK